MYFYQGLKYQEIVCMLLVRHGYFLCIRQLKRILKKVGLQRRHRNMYSPIDEVTDVVRSELSNYVLDIEQCGAG